MKFSNRDIELETLSDGTFSFRLKAGTELKIRVAMPIHDPCEHCGGLYHASLEVDAGGYSAGGGHAHTPTCKTQFCEHGIRWTDECKPCDDNDSPEYGELEPN